MSNLNPGDTVSFAAGGQLSDGDRLTSGSRVRLVFLKALIPKDTLNPIQIQVRTDTLTLGSGEKQLVNGDIVSATFLRTRTPDGRDDVCMPLGGQVRVQLKESGSE